MKLRRNRAILRTARTVLPAGLLVSLLAGCQGGSANPATPATPTPATTSPATNAPIPASPVSTSPIPSGPASANPIPTNPLSSSPTTTSPGPRTSAIPAPSWLSTRVLPTGPDGFGVVPDTPPELRNRRIITKDLLPPPVGGRFASRITAVPADVARRSTWSAACPVALRELRYVTVSFVGFDGWAHTGELLLNRAVADDVVTVFGKLFAARWPIEEMRVISPADLAAPPTGDGNNTSAYACRPVRGASAWSQHAYGLAIDVNPFHNPYVDGHTVLPELAKSYAKRGKTLPGMNKSGSAPVLAFQSIGWGWGGGYSTKKDWMHFSSTGK